MSIELLRQRQKTLECLLAAVDSIKAVFTSLPRLQLSQDDAEAFADEIKHMADEYKRSLMDQPIQENVNKVIGPPVVISDPTRTPVEVVEDVLREAMPSGLTPSEIISRCEGRFRTKSGDPKSVIYAAIGGLKKRGRIEQIEDGRYRCVRHAGEFAFKTAIECCAIILHESKEPKNALTLAREALARGYVGRAKATTEDGKVMTTAKSFWARMSRSHLFEQTEPETFRLKPGVTAEDWDSDREERPDRDDMPVE